MTRPPTEVGERTYKTWRTCPTFRTTPRSVSTFFKRRERSTAPTQSNDDGSGSPKHSDKGFHSFQRTNSVALRFPRLVATPPNSTDGRGHSSDDAPPPPKAMWTCGMMMVFASKFAMTETTKFRRVQTASESCDSGPAGADAFPRQGHLPRRPNNVPATFGDNFRRIRRHRPAKTISPPPA